MKRSIEDIQLDKNQIEVTIQGLMEHLKRLDEEEAEALLRIHKKNYGYYVNGTLIK